MLKDFDESTSSFLLGDDISVGGLNGFDGLKDGSLNKRGLKGLKEKTSQGDGLTALLEDTDDPDLDNLEKVLDDLDISVLLEETADSWGDNVQEDQDDWSRDDMTIAVDIVKENPQNPQLQSCIDRIKRQRLRIEQQTLLINEMIKLLV